MILTVDDERLQLAHSQTLIFFAAREQLHRARDYCLGSIRLLVGRFDYVDSAFTPLQTSAWNSFLTFHGGAGRLLEKFHLLPDSDKISDVAPKLLSTE